MTVRPLDLQAAEKQRNHFVQKSLVSDFGFSPVQYTKYVVLIYLVLAVLEVIVLLQHSYNWAKKQFCEKLWGLLSYPVKNFGVK